MDRAVEILADCVCHPVISEEEVGEARGVMELMKTALPSEMFSKDAVQRAAYGILPDGSSQAMGNYHYAPSEQLPLITADKVMQFRNRMTYGENCVISAAGIDHDHLMRLCKQYFEPGTATTSTSSGSSTALPIVSNPASYLAKASRAKPVFTGGLIVERRELKEPNVRVSIGFEVGGWKGPDLVPACVLQQIMGGGSSFSAGGPGKGMYTRLYQNILNQYYWAESAQSFVLMQDHCGLIGIDGSVNEPAQVSSLLRVLIDQIYRFGVEEVTEAELDRAKNMLKSMMMMQLESRLVLCEDIARQVERQGTS